MKDPIISVILPVYNAEKFIHEAIQSVLNQTFEDFELIIINDGSSDLSDKIIRQFNDKRIVYKYRENKGLSYTLNEMIDMSSSDIIARMDADDICTEDRLSKQFDKLNSNNQLVMVSSNVTYIDELGKFIGNSVSPSLSRSVKNKLSEGNIIFHPTVMFRKSACIKVGGYNNKIDKYIEDYLLWMNILNFGDVYVLPDITLKYRVHEQAISSNVPIQLNNLVRKISRNNGDYDDLELDYIKCINGGYESIERNVPKLRSETYRRLLIWLKNLYFYYRIH